MSTEILHKNVHDFDYDQFKSCEYGSTLIIGYC